MKIRTKILFCLLAGFTVSLVGLWAIDRAVERVEFFREASVHAQNRLVALTNFRAHVRNEILETLTALFVQNEEVTQPMDIASARGLEPRFRQLQISGLDHAEVQKLREVVSPLLTQLQQALALAKEGRGQAARDLLERAKRESFERDFLPPVSVLILRQTQEMQDAGESLNESIEVLRRNLLFGSLIVLILTLILTVFLSRSLSRRLRRLEDAAHQVAVGNFTLNLDDSGRDEISILARAFDSMVKRLIETRKQLSEQQELLLNTAKMSALGEMAAGMAHEINTPLGAMILNAEMILQKLNPQNEGAELISKRARKIVQIGERIGKIIEGLKFFARDGRYDEVEKFPVRRWIDATLDLCSERFRNHGVEIEVLGTSLDEMVEGRLVQLSQVLLNLLNNSFDAIEALSEKWILIEVEPQEAELLVRVIDSGPGVPVEIVDKIFQPFYTTKPIGKGTGLGLSLSRGLVRSHGGELTYVKSARGTCFVIHLPRSSLERNRI